MERSKNMSEGNEVRERISLTYSGIGLSNGDFDVRSLGPALSAVYELLAEVNNKINGPNRKIKVTVQSWRIGSFNIDLNVIQSVKEQAMEFLVGTSVTSTINLLALVGFAKTGFDLSVIKLYRFLKGEIPNQVYKNNDSTVTIRSENGDITVNNNVYNLYCNEIVSKNLAQIISPLKNDGIEKLEIKHDSESVETILKNEVIFFNRANSEKKELSVTVRRTKIGFKKLILPFTNTSKFKEGSFEFFAKITDKDFLSKNSNGSFSLNDSLDVDLLIREIENGDSTTYEFEIIKVYEHIKGPVQIEMKL